jgi:hypothetical protein
MSDLFGGLRTPWNTMEEDEKSWTVTLDLLLSNYRQRKMRHTGEYESRANFASPL